MGKVYFPPIGFPEYGLCNPVVPVFLALGLKQGQNRGQLPQSVGLLDGVLLALLLLKYGKPAPFFRR